MAKGFIAEGASFWYVIFGLFSLYVGDQSIPSLVGEISVLFGFLYLLMAFVAWKSPGVGNLIAIALSVIIVYLVLSGNLEASGVGSSALVLVLIALFFGFSAYRGRKSAPKTPN